MMNKKNLPKSYWAELSITVLYLMNRCTKFGLHNVTPHEKYYERKADLSHVRLFGLIVYVHILEE